MFRVFLITAVFLINQEVDSSLQCKFLETINITDGYKDSNQNFIYKGDVYPLGTYQEFDFIENYKHEKTDVDPHIRGCVCKLKPCIRLCCRGDQFANKHMNCSDSSIFTVKNEKDEDEIINIDENKYGILVGRPCDSIFPLYKEDEEDYWILNNDGSLHVSEDNHKVDDYCLSISDESNTEAYLCFHKEHDTRFDIYPIGMLFSIPFLLLTIIVYACIPELRNLHGKCLIGYTSALTILFISLSLVQMDFFAIKLDHSACTLLGYLIYFCVFLSFFWMNVMCFDIWTMARHGIINRTFSEERKVFTKYCFYALGIPLLMTLFVILIDFYEIFDEEYLPLFGRDKCYIKHSYKVEAIYVYIPMSVIIIINIILFVDTARIIWKSQSATNDENVLKRRRILRDRFTIYLRLFIVMGMTWCMESISWAFQNNHTIFKISDFVNCMLGFFIFLVCVCNRRARRLIRRRCCQSNSLPNESDDTYAADFTVTNETMKMSES